MSGVNELKPALLVGLATLLLSASVDASQSEPEPPNCVPDRGCPKGLEPGEDCCQPPPCEFYQALRLARAKANITRNLMRRFGNAEGNKAAMHYANESYRQGSALLEQANPCPSNPGLEEPPLLDVDDEHQCEIRYFEDFDNQIGALSLDDYLANYRTCREQLEAKYAQAEERRRICLEEQAREGSRPLFDKMLQDLGDAVAEELDLEAELHHYRSVCTVSDEDDNARQAALLGVESVKQEPPRKRPPKKPNPRAGSKKPSRGSR